MKKIKLFINSFSVFIKSKPIAVLLFIMVVAMSTIALAPPFYNFYYEIGEVYHKEYLSLINKDGSDVDLSDINKYASTIEKLNKNGLFKENALLDITVIGMNIPLIHNKEKHSLSNVNVSFVISGYEILEKKAKEHNNQVIAIRKNIAIKYGIKINDEVLFSGNKVKVVDIHNNTNRGGISVPHNINLSNYKFVLGNPYNDRNQPNQDTFYHCGGGGITISGLNRFLTSEETRIISDIGMMQSTPIISSQLWNMFMWVLPVVVITVVNLIYALHCIQKENNKKYKVYKVLGITPLMLGMLVISELMFLSFFGVAIGLIVDSIIAITTARNALQYLKLAYYMSIVFVPILLSFVMSLIRIIKYTRQRRIDLQ